MPRDMTNGTRYAPWSATLERCGALADRLRGHFREGGSPDDRSRQELGLVEPEPGWNEWVVGPFRLAGRPAVRTVRLVGTAGAVGLLVTGRHPRQRLTGRREHSQLLGRFP